jgi:hypothetical protein
MTTKLPPLVLVTWEDASAPDDGPWVENRDHGYQAQMFETVGFLLYDGPDGITLTSSWSDKYVAGRDFIPRGMVHKIKKLRA